MIEKTYSYVKNFFQEIGEMFILFYEILYWIFKGKYDLSNMVLQFYEVGAASFPIVLITSFATGMVLALQLGIVMQNWFGYPIFVGMTVSFAFAKELSPILVAIVMAGRSGAAITAEIGSMKVTEQIDALYSLGAHPVQYLAVPRFLSCFFMIPMLTILGFTTSIIGGMVVSSLILKIPTTVYLSDALDYMYVKDLLHGLIKSFCFASIVSWISIYKGFSCKQGAQGVGRATTSSVVLSIILILVSDYFLTSILVGLGIGSGSK